MGSCWHAGLKGFACCLYPCRVEWSGYQQENYFPGDRYPFFPFFFTGRKIRRMNPKGRSFGEGRRGTGVAGERMRWDRERNQIGTKTRATESQETQNMEEHWTELRLGTEEISQSPRQVCEYFADFQTVTKTTVHDPYHLPPLTTISTCKCNRRLG